MIIDLDPYFPTPLAFTGRLSTATQGQSRKSRRPERLAPVQERSEREASFERAHGSLWIPGMLDRLSLPLTRIHE
jgi:hypothetical protein